MKRHSEGLPPTPPRAGSISARELRLHTDLQTHQIELEMQNHELARARAELERSRARYFALFDLAPVAYFTFSRQGVIEQLNLTAAELLQLDRQRLVGHTLSVHLDTVSARHFSEHLDAVFEERTRQTVNLKLRPTDDRGVRHLLVVSRLIEGEASEAPQSLSACFDLTEQHQTEEARKQLERQLVNTQRLESLGQLAGGIAHDFNNLLTGILGHAELLEMSEALGAGEQQCVTMIRKASTSAARLCQQMLASAGRSNGSLEAVDLNETITDAIALISVSLNKNVTITARLDPDLQPVHGDFAQLNQAVLNLLMNAEEAIGEEAGTIEVGSRLTQLEPGYRDTAFFGPDVPPGEYAELWVSDSGVGMSPVTLAHIFDPFFTTKFTGRGLGLSTVFGTVRWHNGTIAVRSAPGVGATFRIFLPAQRRAAPAPNVLQPKIRETRSLAGRCILLVEDEEPVRLVITSLLERAGARVITAVDGQAALDAYQEHRDKITHILLDLIMPGMSGEETLRQLKELNPDLPPVIVLSGYASPETQARLDAHGVAAQLRKPCSILQLAGEIANAG